MRKSIEKGRNSLNTKTKKAISIGSILLGLSGLVGCEEEKKVNENVNINTTKEKITISLPYGLKGSNLQIKTMNGSFSYNTKDQDEDGNIVIDYEDFKNTLVSYGIPLDQDFLIETTGGYNSDTDFDGNLEEVKENINGKIRGILKLDQLNGVILNPIFTYATDILLGVNNEKIKQYLDKNGKVNSGLIDSKLQEIFNQIKIDDTNGDGKRNINDLLTYNGNDNSELEQTLRNSGYFETIINGNNEKRQEIINILTGDNGGNNNGGTDNGGGDVVDDGDNSGTDNGGGEVVDDGDNGGNDNGGGDVVYDGNDGGNDNGGGDVVDDGNDGGNNNGGGDVVDDGNDGGNDNGGGEVIDDYVPQKISFGTKENIVSNENINNLTSSGNIEIETGELLEKQLLVDQDKIDSLNSQLNKISGDIIDTNNRLNSTYLNLGDLNSDLDYLNSANSGIYYSLDENGKVIVNPYSSTYDKNTAVDNVSEGISGTSLMKSVRAKSVKGNYIPTDNMTVQEGGNLLQIKISSLESEINSLKKELEIKKQAYEKKYQEYLEAKKIYEEDRKLFLDAHDRYQKLNNQYNTLKDEVTSALRNRDLYSDELVKLVEPRNTHYVVSTKIYTKYIGTHSILKLTLTYKGKSMKGYLTLPSTGKFPGDLWVEVDGKKSNLIKVNNENHLNDLSEYLLNSFKYTLDIKYYSDLYTKKQAELQKLENSGIQDKIDDAYYDTLIYGLIASVGKDMYKEELDTYNNMKLSYDNLYSTLQPKITRLGNLKNKLRDLLNGLIGVKDIEYDINYVENEVDKLNNNLEGLNNLKETKSQELIIAEQGQEVDVAKNYAVFALDTIQVGNKYFTVSMGANVEDKLTQEQLEQKLKEKVAKLKNTDYYETFEYMGETVQLMNRVIYYIDGVNEYPALMWGEYNGFGVYRESKVYRIDESYPGEGNGVKEDIGNQLQNMIGKIGTYWNYENLFPGSKDELCQYKGVVHYDFDNKGGSKVGIHYKIGNHEYYKYNEQLAKTEAEKETIFKKMLEDLKKTIKVSSKTGMNTGKQAYWNGEYFTMNGGAYNIYSVPDGYLATYTVELGGGTWHTSVVWSDVNALKTEVERIINNWFTKNEKAPVDPNVDDGREEEEICLQPGILTLENLNKIVLEYEKLNENKQKQYIYGTSYNNFLEYLEKVNQTVIAGELLDKYIQEDGFNIKDGVNDEMEFAIIGALRSIDYNEAQSYIKKLEAMGVSGESLARIKLISYKGTYAEGIREANELIDIPLMLYGGPSLIKGSYSLLKMGGNATFGWVKGISLAEIRNVERKVIMDLSKSSKIKIKYFNNDFYKQIKNGTIKILNSDGVEYSFKNGGEKLIQHLKSANNGKSYFNTNNVDDVYDIIIEGVGKLKKVDFDEVIKLSNGKGYVVDMGRIIGTHKDQLGKEIITSKLRLIFTQEGKVHGFPISPNHPVGHYIDKLNIIP